MPALLRPLPGPTADSPFSFGLAIRKELREGMGELEIIGMERAAEICGLGRTQMWRYAKNSRLPHFVTGTPDHPEYKFRLHDVQAFKRIRDRERASRELRAMKRRLRAAHLELHRIGGRAVLVRSQRVLAS